MPLISTAGIKPVSAHNWATFVRSAVKTFPGVPDITRDIINAVMPYFPKDCKCIAGYLDSDAQYWKVNFHWDLLLGKIDDFLASSKPSETLKTSARLIRDMLMVNPPSPLRGYRDDKEVGQTKDVSSRETIVARHGILKHAKRDFESVIVNAGVVDVKTKHSPAKAHKVWWLAVAPVATPGVSKHGTGYALDIAGNSNTEIVRIAKGLGATLAFNEASHVHLEWKNGVTKPF